MLKVLDVEGAVERDGTRWIARPGQRAGTTTPSATRSVTALRRREQAAMAALRRRRALPDARAAGGARRSRPAGLRALLGLHRAALRRAAGPGARARGGAAPALAAARARGQEDGAGRRGPDAQDRRRTCAPRRAARWRGSATAAGTRSCSAGRRRRALRRRAGRRPPPSSCATWGAPVRWVTAVPSLRTRRARAGLRAAAGRGARAAVRAGAASASADGPPQREMANAAQQVANVRGAFAVAGDAAGRAGACSSTTSASAAGRWRWSAGQLRRSGAGPVFPFALATAF